MELIDVHYLDLDADRTRAYRDKLVTFRIPEWKIFGFVLRKEQVRKFVGSWLVWNHYETGYRCGLDLEMEIDVHVSAYEARLAMEEYENAVYTKPSSVGS